MVSFIKGDHVSEFIHSLLNRFCFHILLVPLSALSYSNKIYFYFNLFFHFVSISFISLFLLYQQYKLNNILSTSLLLLSTLLLPHNYVIFLPYLPRKIDTCISQGPNRKQHTKNQMRVIRWSFIYKGATKSFC